jgi:hypothetical protein
MIISSILVLKINKFNLFSIMFIIRIHLYSKSEFYAKVLHSIEIEWFPLLRLVIHKFNLHIQYIIIFIIIIFKCIYINACSIARWVSLSGLLSNCLPSLPFNKCVQVLFSILLFLIKKIKKCISKRGVKMILLRLIDIKLSIINYDFGINLMLWISYQVFKQLYPMVMMISCLDLPISATYFNAQKEKNEKKLISFLCYLYFNSNRNPINKR